MGTAAGPVTITTTNADRASLITPSTMRPQ